MSNFHVELKKVIDDSYDVEIGFNLINKMIEDLKNGLVKGINKFAIITDSEVEKLYANKVYEQIKNSGLQADLFMFPAGEKNKTRRTKEFIEDSMLEKSYRRDCCIIAVGGGVVTDLAGFVAGTYGRGVPFINFATTHLAAADASIGIVAQVNLGNKLGYINDEDRDRVITLLERACLPITIPDYIDLENLIKKLYTDKKVRDGKIRFVFQKGIGDVQKFGNDIYAIPIDESEIKEILEKM